MNPAGLEAHREHDATLDWMLKEGVEPTRDNYISLNYAGRPPEPWTAEHEMMLPEPFQNK